MNHLRFSLAVLSVAFSVTSLQADGPNFRADTLFKGSSLTGWRQFGEADWKADQGEIVGEAKQAEGGWLILDHSFQNVAVYMNVYCSGACKTGVLLRAEKTTEGMKGLFVSLTPGDLGSYAVTLDSRGKELTRNKLPSTDSEGGLASAMGNIPPEKLAFLRQPGSRPLPLPSEIKIPDLQPPSNKYHEGGWNDVNIVLYQDMLDPALGAGGFSTQKPELSKVAARDEDGAYGPIALYVGGSGKVQFKDVRYKDLNVLTSQKDYSSPSFSKLQLSRLYFSWSTAVADINHDGIPDVIAGPYYFLGPDFRVAHEIYTPITYNPGTDYPQTSMVNLAWDFTGDGWPDVLVMSGSAGFGIGTLYVNPKGESRHWQHYVVLDPVGNEDTLLKDIDGDGKPEVLHAGNNTLQYSRPDPANPTGKWITKTISERGPWGASIGHGLGVGDIDGDGLMDYVNAYGWWQQPAKGSGETSWTYHPQEFGRFGHTQGGAGGAELGIYDVNGDGLNDVVVSLEGHGFGLAWFEQKRAASGAISFVEHVIMDNFLTKNAGDVMFTEPHATEFADMDGDGIPDLITGKRAMSHLFDYGDPDPFGPAVLYVYKTVRDKNAPGGAKFVPILVDNASGVGSHFSVVDLNGDGAPDIATSGIYGTFVFMNHLKAEAHSSTRAKR